MWLEIDLFCGNSIQFMQGVLKKEYKRKNSDLN